MLTVRGLERLERLERSETVEPFDRTQGRLLERLEPLEQLEPLERLEPGGAWWVLRGPVSQRNQR